MRCVLSFLTAFFIAGSLLAEPPRGSQFGEILLEEEQVAKDQYPAWQNAAIEYFRAMEERMKNAATGGPLTVQRLEENSLIYLAAAYLYCAGRSGSCPIIPEAVLEGDLLNSAALGKVECPASKRFWAAWVRSDMEKRLGYLVQTSHMEAVQRFNSKERPRLVKCEETIKEILGSGEKKEVFRSRYSSSMPESKLASKAVALLSMIRQKVPNVFHATGTLKKNEPRSATEQR